jgi:predicted 3-demethylubiquinone-9 3-methyltransferase (glyoxalase superfamily)
MQKIVPFLWFDGKAEEAMNFYTAIFKNSKVVTLPAMAMLGPVPRERSCRRHFSSTGRNSWR